jgi:hypothetical protein
MKLQAEIEPIPARWQLILRSSPRTRYPKYPRRATATLTLSSRTTALFTKRDVVYVARNGEYRCPPGECPIHQFTIVERDMNLRAYWPSASPSCHPEAMFGQRLTPHPTMGARTYAGCCFSSEWTCAYPANCLPHRPKISRRRERAYSHGLRREGGGRDFTESLANTRTLASSTLSRMTNSIRCSPGCLSSLK